MRTQMDSRKRALYKMKLDYYRQNNQTGGWRYSKCQHPGCPCTIYPEVEADFAPADVKPVDVKPADVKPVDVAPIESAAAGVELDKKLDKELIFYLLLAL